MQGRTQLYRWVYNTTWFGFGLSAAILLAGCVVSLLSSGALPSDVLSAVPALLAALRGDGAGLVSIGLLGLLVTPFVTVLTSIIALAIARDAKAAFAGLGVSLMMVLSFLLRK